MRRLPRREALRLLGSGAAAGIASLRSSSSRVTARPAQDVSFPRGAAFPRGAIIRTLLNDVAPHALGAGAVLFHEHLSARWGRTTHYSDDVALMTEEVRASKAEGVACIVDAGHPDVGRSMAALRRIAQESQVPIVASGGYYTQRLYPADIASRSVESLTEELVRTAADERHGAFGEIGQEGEMTADERKVFEAVGRAHLQTNLPVFTHNAYMGRRPARVAADSALRQLDLLERVGVDPHRVALGHMCCLDDPQAKIASEAAARGAFIGFDRVTLALLPDADKVVMILKLLEAGHASKILLSSDFAQESALKKNGGPGLAQTVTVFGARLRKAGVPEPTLREILEDNPRRFLAFVPKA